METLTATSTIAQAPTTPIIFPAEYSQRRCNLCTQYHGTENCDPRMVAHTLRTF